MVKLDLTSGDSTLITLCGTWTVHEIGGLIVIDRVVTCDVI